MIRHLGWGVLSLAASAVVVTGCASESEDAGNADSNIVGGVEAAPNTWPIVGLTDTGGSFRCGGSLVAERWVLTAAHCIDRTRTNGGLGNILVRRHRLSIPEGESHRVLRAIAHPSYNDITKDNDIALLELATSSFAPKAVLVTPSQVSLAGAGVTATVVGWGATREGGGVSDVLRQASIPIVSISECRALSQVGTLTGNMICAGFRDGGRDSCQGDSGGPLFVKANATVFQVGIVSFGVGCARAFEPGVYTRASNYLDWIARTSNFEIPVDGGGTSVVVSGSVGPIPRTTLDTVDEYRVATELLNCRQAPGTQAPVSKQVPLGTIVNATSEPGRPRVGIAPDGRPWLLVRVQGTACYASADHKFITPTEAPPPPPPPAPIPTGPTAPTPIPLVTLNSVNTYRIATQLLNCRAQPGTDTAVITTVPQGTVVTATEDATRSRIGFSSEGKPWLLIKTEVATCYASADFKFLTPVP